MTELAQATKPKLFESAEQAIKSSRGLPPLHLWNPPLNGDLDMRIARDGQWFYQGTAITRSALVRLFSTILRREGDEYFLVTPVEKWRIKVELVPFVVLFMEVDRDERGQLLRFVTNVGDSVVADAQHPLRVDIHPVRAEPKPFIAVRDGLDALINRAVFYQLVELAQERIIGEQTVQGVESAGQFFILN